MSQPMSPSPEHAGVENGALATQDRFEKLAFQFCKIATFALLLGRFTLPVAASLAAVLFIAAYFHGKRTSRCFVRYPLLIAGLWVFVVAGWVYSYTHPYWWRTWF